MKKTVYTILTMLTLGVSMKATAQTIEVPEDAPRETWQFIYDDYRSIYWTSSPEYNNLSRNVTVIRGEDCLYVQGIAKGCPDSWVKIGLTDESVNIQLLLWNNQSVTVEGSTKYLITGYIKFGLEPHNTAVDLNISGNVINTPLVFKRDLSSDQLEYTGRRYTAFWLRDEPDKGFYHSYVKDYDNPTPPDDTNFPDDEIYMNPRLVDKTAGIGSVHATASESETSVYTLSGIKADRDHLAPGVYVSNGKKIMVK